MKQEREQLLVGLLASVTANYSINHPEKSLSPSDFMPGRKEPELSDEDLAAKINAILLPRAIPA